MTTVRLAVPLARIRSQLTLNVGRPWSIVEHLILEALLRRPLSIGDIEQGYSIPRQLIEESLHRLMRVEWVEMRPVDDQLRFSATLLGLKACAADPLPYVGKHAERTRSQIIERLTGHLFRPNDLRQVRRSELDREYAGPRIHYIDPCLPDGMYCADEIVEVAVDEHEEVLTLDTWSEPWPNHVALFDVSNTGITGLPKDRELEDLRLVLLRSAHKLRASQPAHTGSRSRRHHRSASVKQHRIRFLPDDLVIGGPAHRQALLSIVNSAQSRLIIHTTFLDANKFLHLLNALVAATRRGVTIDILWGQDPPDPDQPSGNHVPAQYAAERLREDPRIVAIADRLRIHDQCTYSHAKVIVADLNEPGNYIALVGSCNWLSSPFKSIEASVYLREPSVVSEIALSLLRLCYASVGGWDGLAGDLLHIRHELQYRRSTSSPNGKAALVVGDEHNEYMIRARDEARRSVFVTSNRLGRYFKPGALTPLAMACAKERIKTRILYSLLQGIGIAEESQFARDAAAHHVRLKLHKNPKIHAKVLAWDDNAAVVTSQNWLSADPGHTTLATELGIALDVPGIGKLIRDGFNAALNGHHNAPNRRRRKGSGSQLRVSPEQQD